MGRPRKVQAIEEVPLVGGEVCLDFVNTTGGRESGKPRERLHEYPDLLIWSRRVGILDDAGALRLGRLAAAGPREANEVLRQAVSLRESLYLILRQVVGGGAPDPEITEQLASWWRRYRSRRELVFEGHAFRLRTVVDEDDLDLMVWPIVQSAIALLTAGRMSAVKRCGECDWLFLDETKNQTRTWCKQQCGNRARARRYYERRRADA